MSETIATKGRPIIFGAESIRAILRGEKTQTRRIIDPTKHYHPDRATMTTIDTSRNPVVQASAMPIELVRGYCPYGGTRIEETSPGVCEWVWDRLWVRETFTEVPLDPIEETLGLEPVRDFIYRADPQFDSCGSGDFAWKWRSPIHMPREASRILLEITDVRAERLQQITEGEAIAEGVPCMAHVVRVDHVFGRSESDRIHPDGTHRYGFQVMWDRINGKRASWASNPWVWVISFKRVEVNHG